MKGVSTELPPVSERHAPYRALSDAATILNAAVTERQLQNKVITWARLAGWRVFHPWSSKHSEAGFPDLVLLRPPRLVFVELKRLGKVPTTDQETWLYDLQLVECVKVYVWRPGDEAEIERVLARTEERS